MRALRYIALALLLAVFVAVRWALEAEQAVVDERLDHAARSNGHPGWRPWLDRKMNRNHPDLGQITEKQGPPPRRVRWPR